MVAVGIGMIVDVWVWDASGRRMRNWWILQNQPGLRFEEAWLEIRALFCARHALAVLSRGNFSRVSSMTLCGIFLGQVEKRRNFLGRVVSLGRKSVLLPIT